MRSGKAGGPEPGWGRHDVHLNGAQLLGFSSKGRRQTDTERAAGG